MLLYGDYHTHTKYSRNGHGKSTIEENVKTAYEKGLKEIGITEHGFRHATFGVRKKNIKKMRAEIERLKKIYPINIYLGIEANLISSEGDIDLSAEEQQWFDYVIMGYHKLALPKNLREYFKFFKPNAKAFKKNSYTQEIVEANTLAYIKAIKKNRINIISHIGSKMKVDVVQIAKVCQQTGTLIEINGRRICFEPAEIQKLISIGTKFIIDSDAHIASNVGECNKPTNFAIMHNIPKDLIVNLDKKPEFVWRKDE
jgi:putative hydrolase